MKNKIINLFIILIVLVIGIIMYSKYIGTKGLVVKEYKIASEKIPSSFSGVKIVFFSDLLYGSTVNYNDLEELIEKINELKPDILLFGGNLVSNNYKMNENTKDKISILLSKLNAKLGKYYVLGNSDDEKISKILKDFILIDNSTETLYNEDNNQICLSGIGSFLNNKYSVDKISCENTFHIIMSHEPDIIDSVINLKPDLFLAGNTLGGEINVPKFGYLEKFDGSKKYYKEYYQKDDTKIYISTGLGTKKKYKRLFNKPSISLFRLKSMN